MIKNHNIRYSLKNIINFVIFLISLNSEACSLQSAPPQYQRCVAFQNVELEHQ